MVRRFRYIDRANALNRRNCKDYSRVTFVALHIGDLLDIHICLLTIGARKPFPRSHGGFPPECMKRAFSAFSTSFSFERVGATEDTDYRHSRFLCGRGKPGLNARTSQFGLRPLGFVRPIKTASRWSQPYRVLHRFRASACNHSSVFSSINRRLLSAFDPATHPRTCLPWSLP